MSAELAYGGPSAARAWVIDGGSTEDHRLFRSNTASSEDDTVESAEDAEPTEGAKDAPA